MKTSVIRAQPKPTPPPKVEKIVVEFTPEELIEVLRAAYSNNGEDRDRDPAIGTALPPGRWLEYKETHGLALYGRKYSGVYDLLLAAVDAGLVSPT